MTPDQFSLLITVARILRARLPELSTAYQADDLAALNEALAPYDPVPQHGGDFEESARVQMEART